jgi:hypothetical protein
MNDRDDRSRPADRIQRGHPPPGGDRPQGKKQPWKIAKIRLRSLVLMQLISDKLASSGETVANIARVLNRKPDSVRARAARPKIRLPKARNVKL